jgi:hypothetical protein
MNPSGALGDDVAALADEPSLEPVLGDALCAWMRASIVSPAAAAAYGAPKSSSGGR